MFGKDRLIFWRESASGDLPPSLCLNNFWCAASGSVQVARGSEQLHSARRAAHDGVLLRAPGDAPDRHPAAARHLHERLLHAHAAGDPLHGLLHQCAPPFQPPRPFAAASKPLLSSNFWRGLRAYQACRRFWAGLRCLDVLWPESMCEPISMLRWAAPTARQQAAGCGAV